MGKDLYAQLREEHQGVKDLLTQALECSEEEREGILIQIEREFIPHARAEEQTLYSLLQERAGRRNSPQAMDIVNEAFEEHEVIDQLLFNLKETSVESERWEAQMNILKENIEHHLQEEEGELFKRASEFIEKHEISEIYEEYKEAKEQFKQELPSQRQVFQKITPSDHAFRPRA
ncbi:MAG: hemerythrin domain-containing protein [Bdellovibrionales bacterium]|nr:hemerythrin domain-containing protein [Bdellovibrionales bacterium]